MPCDQQPALLSAYLDGELTPQQAADIHAHIATCSHCVLEIAELVTLRRTMRHARNHFTPTNEFRLKMQQQFAKPKPRFQINRIFPLGLAFATVLVLAFTFTYLQYSRPAATFSEVADLHINALASANPLDVVSTDRHTVKPWFQGRIPFSFNLPEFAGTEFTLLGGRLVYLHQQPGAQLIVGFGQHKISVLIFQNPSTSLIQSLSSDAPVSNRNSFNVESWRSNNLRFFIIGDAEPIAIHKLSQSLKQANN